MQNRGCRGSRVYRGPTVNNTRNFDSVEDQSPSPLCCSRVNYISVHTLLSQNLLGLFKLFPKMPSTVVLLGACLSNVICIFCVDGNKGLATCLRKSETIST